MTNEEYIQFLEKKGENYVWQFTKQEVDFDKIFLATKLFNEWKNSETEMSQETFFSQQHSKYGITDRHRTLIIAQLYGLITKNNSTYVKECVTPVFEKLSRSVDSETYKKIVTEQLLKIKLPALTYSRVSGASDVRHIFPIIFTYQVLKSLKSVGIKNISIDEFYTYVMTANFHSDLERVVQFLTQPIKPIIGDSLLRLYKDRSRIVPLIKNLNIFIFDDENISINPIYEYVMDEFLRSKLSLFLKRELTNSEIYKNFLYNAQNLDINLINEDVDVVISGDIDELKDEAEYTENVVSQEISKITHEKVETLATIEPVIVTEGERFVIKRDAAIGVLAIANSEYKCEFDENHETFISKRTKNRYMEAHHLIPISQTKYIWKKKHANVDCIENIVSLCPTCHRAIHHGEFDIKLTILKKLYDKKYQDLKKVGLDVDFETLLKFYL